MRGVIRNIVGSLFRGLLQLLRWIGGDASILLKEYAKEVERWDRVFVTYHDRPVQATQINLYTDVVHRAADLAVVLQGPLWKDHDFTLETVKLYRRHFGSAAIIVSTWDDEESEVVSELVNLGAEVLLNEKPAYSGTSNINLQIVSSRNGILRAKELGVEYVVKTRTDQRMYAPDIGDFLHNMVETFPVSRDATLKGRVVGVSLNTFKYRMYGLSDMLTYGHIEDLLLYWSTDLDMRIFSQEEIRRFNTPRKWAKCRLCEVYLATEFLKKVGHDLKWTLEDSWLAFARYFCVVDKEQLDMFWPKYNRLEYPSRTYKRLTNSFQELSFRDWLNIYRNLDSMEVPDEVAGSE